MTTIRERCDEPSTLLILDKNYKPYSTVCPGCDLRHGEPNRHLWIDVVRCKPCQVKLITPKKQGKNKNKGLM
jgi:hypothetical protein